jgi:4-amino-4-deoxy-L-arabinose transferase-like glycosyltransferase
MDLFKKPHLNKVSFHCIFILTVYVILVIIRLPILINADFFLTSDEGYIASETVDLLQGGQFHFFYENVSYEGTVNGWITALFFWLFGVNSLIFKLPAILFYTLYIWSFFLMVMRSNKKVAWVSVALLVLCPPKILFLTTLNYGLFLAAFIGNVAFLRFFSNIDNPSSVKVFYINFLLGFSLYI